MITAVDTVVLMDVLQADRRFGPASADAIRRCLAEGSLTACEAVWAETAAGFASAEEAARKLERLRVSFSPLEARAALTAGEAWRAHRRRGGPRRRVVADFLIGAHAMHQADRLVTRDRGFYRTYFKRLKILDPAGA